MKESEPEKKQETETDEREAEATSKETLEDLERSEEIPDSKLDRSEKSTGPAPDGTTDERRNERDDAGPM